MTASKPKSFRTRIATEVRDRYGLSDEQHKAMLAEFNRRLLQFAKSWLRCGNKRCRRCQECLGPPFLCNGGAAPRVKNRQYRRLRNDLLRNPPQI